MKTLQTERLLLRPLEPSDDLGMFALDSNPKVHLHLGNNPVQSIEESRAHIEHIRKQYVDNGIARYAVVEKSSGDFVGWSGLKLERDVNGRETFYDLGYRLREEFWGKGYATESAKAFIEFGFDDMKLEVINAYTSHDNVGSQKTLEKCGLIHTETFEYEGAPEFWYELKNPNT